jgi:hypothetical protein
MAERHIAEGEARVTRLEGIIRELDRDNHPRAAMLGRSVLATFRASLALSAAQLAALKEAAASSV